FPAGAPLGHLHGEHGLVGLRIRAVDLLQQMANRRRFDPIRRVDIQTRPAQLERQQRMRWLALQSLAPWPACRKPRIEEIVLTPGTAPWYCPCGALPGANRRIHLAPESTARPVGSGGPPARSGRASVRPRPDDP